MPKYSALLVVPECAAIQPYVRQSINKKSVNFHILTRARAHIIYNDV